MTITTEEKLEKLLQNIRSAIESSDYKPAEIARILDMHKSNISMWMNGKRVPTAKNLIELASALNIKSIELWENIDSEKKQTVTRKHLLNMLEKLNEEQIAAISVIVRSMMPPPEIEEILSSVKSLGGEKQKAITMLSDLIKAL